MTLLICGLTLATVSLGAPALGQRRDQGQRNVPGRPDITIGKVGALQSLVVNGRPVNRDMTPRTIGGTVMVPLRFVGEYLGATVHWERDKGRVWVMRERQKLTMTVGTTRATENGEGRALSQPPVIRGGRVLIPLREVARFFDAQVDYNPQTRVVNITTPGGAAGTQIPREGL